MPHFFCPPENISAGRFVLPAEESRHVSSVLRKKIGDEIPLFDGKGNAFFGKITAIAAGAVSGEIISAVSARPQKSPRIIFYQALCKKQKLDDIIDKLSQLGVSEITPVVTERTIVKMDPPAAARKLARWSALAVSASKQCNRNDVLAVNIPMSFAAARETAAGSGFPTIIAWEGEKANVKKLLGGLASRGLAGINVFIGPEGGFSAREIETARAAGALTLGLGERILRADTAAIALAAALAVAFSDEE